MTGLISRSISVYKPTNKMGCVTHIILSGQKSGFLIALLIQLEFSEFELSSEMFSKA